MNREQELYIRQVLPEIKINEVIENDQGWDNYVIIVNHEWVFRFPKRQEIEEKVEREAFLLDELYKASLPLKTPHFRLFYNEEGKLMGVAYKMIKGSPILTINKLSLQMVDKVAQQLGEFLTRLHHLKTAPLMNMGFEREHKKADWLALWQNVQRSIFPYFQQNEMDQVNHFFTDFLTRLYRPELNTYLIHGDLSSDHILYSKESEQLSGIIDFTDAQIADPAYDFAGVYMAYGERFTKKVLSYYKTTLSKEDIYERVHRFYGHQAIFHQLLFAHRNNKGVEALLQKFRNEWIKKGK